MKYIVIEVTLSEETSYELPIIFPNLMIHSEMAGSIRHNLGMVHGWRDTKVISAGSVTLLDGSVTCHGRSETLNMESREHIDTLLIRGHDYTNGFIDL